MKERSISSVFATCVMKSAPYVVDRIKLLHLLDEKFELSCDFNLDEYTKHCFKVMQDELYTVKVRITPAWARYIGEKIWHESQRSRKLPDGFLELTFQVAGLDEIKQWSMSLGPEAYVEEPKRLRDMVKTDLKKALARISHESERSRNKAFQTEGVALYFEG